MARQWYVNGETMITVKGNVNTAIAALTQLGLSEDPVSWTATFRYRDLNLDAWGGEVPPDTQFMLADATVSMTLVHYDVAVLDTCIAEASGGGGGLAGVLSHAGTIMGGNAVRFAANNHYIGLNIASPVGGKPYRFPYAYLAANPIVYPLGTEKSKVQLTWRAVPYSVDPWNGGLGAQGQVIWDNTPDT